MPNAQDRAEALGPYEHTLKILSDASGHLFHGRPGIITQGGPMGVTWMPASRKNGGNDIVNPNGRPLGTLEGKYVNNGGRRIGEFRKTGIVPEIAQWYFEKLYQIWQADAEFSARLASWAYSEDHKDLKMVLCAFMLVQTRKGDPIVEDGEFQFYDDDFRAVGEAMILRKQKGGFNPRMISQVWDILDLPNIKALVQRWGMTRSKSTPARRWQLAVRKWLDYRVANMPLLDGLLKAGFRKTVIRLAKLSRYKGEEVFYQKLRWKQHQSKAGHRTTALNMEIAAADDWSKLDTHQICEKIINDKPKWLSLVPRLPNGLNQAIMAAAIQADIISDQQFVLLTPTLEALNLLQFPEIKERWEKAINSAKAIRAANIAKNVKGEAADKLKAAAENVIKEQVAEAVKNMRLYLLIDVSGSMHGAIEVAKDVLSKFLYSFPKDRLHVSIFNGWGREIVLKAHTQAGVKHALAGISASGGTNHGAGIEALRKYQPKEDEDTLILVIGDQAGESGASFANVIRACGIRPEALAMINVVSAGWGAGSTVSEAAATLRIPYIAVSNKDFEDVYNIPRVLRTMIENTPVGVVEDRGYRTVRVTLVSKILKQPLLERPLWAASKSIAS